MSISTPETQADRTRLSWRRTLILLITVAGIGALDMITRGQVTEAAIAAVICLFCLIPIYRRQLVLRESVRPASWEPAALALGLLLLAVATAIFG